MSEKNLFRRRPLSQSSVSTTMDEPRSVLLRLQKDGDGYIVTDTVGIRYGSGETPSEALQMWADCVQDCCDEPLEKLGHPYLGECLSYRKALHTEPAQAGDSKKGKS